MAIEQAVLDTDTLSLIMRQNPVVLTKAREYLAEHQQFTFSIITRYEILRGLKAKGASRQSENFTQLCTVSQVLPITDPVVVQAADIYADLKRRGELITDADILIAASALVRNFKVITNNESHFRRISNLKVENWLY